MNLGSLGNEVSLGVSRLSESSASGVIGRRQDGVLLEALLDVAPGDAFFCGSIFQLKSLLMQSFSYFQLLSPLAYLDELAAVRARYRETFMQILKMGQFVACEQVSEGSFREVCSK